MSADWSTRHLSQRSWISYLSIELVEISWGITVTLFVECVALVWIGCHILIIFKHVQLLLRLFIGTLQLVELILESLVIRVYLHPISSIIRFIVRRLLRGWWTINCWTNQLFRSWWYLIIWANTFVVAEWKLVHILTFALNFSSRFCFIISFINKLLISCRGLTSGILILFCILKILIMLSSLNLLFQIHEHDLLMPILFLHCLKLLPYQLLAIKSLVWCKLITIKCLLGLVEGCAGATTVVWMWIQNLGVLVAVEIIILTIICNLMTKSTW